MNNLNVSEILKRKNNTYGLKNIPKLFCDCCNKDIEDRFFIFENEGKVCLHTYCNICLYEEIREVTPDELGAWR